MKLQVLTSIATAAVLAVVSCGSGSPHPKLSARIVDFGIVEPVGPQERTPDVSSPTGFITRGDAVFRSHKTTVPARQGVAFGFSYRLKGMPVDEPVRLTRIIRHPPMTKPDGTVIKEQVSYREERSNVGALDAKIYYTMREPYEIVPGHWSITVLQGKTVLAEQIFMVVPAN